MLKRMRSWWNLKRIDLDADAAAILISATHAVKAILDRRAQMDREGKQDETLFVPAGENHAVPAHFIHHMLVLNGIKDKEKTIFCSEDSHDKLVNSYKFDMEDILTHTQRSRLDAENIRGSLLLKDEITHWWTPNAQHSRHILYHYLLRYHLPVLFTDVSKKEKIIDVNEPLTGTILKNHPALANYIENVECASPRGMALRNLHMATLAKAFAQKHRARILFHRCGNDHVIGSENDPAVGSLSQLFKQKVSVLALFQSETDLSEDHGLKANEIFVVSGMPKTTVCYEGDPHAPRALQYLEHEASYTNSILKRCDLAEECLTIEHVLEKKRAYKQELANIFKAIRDRKALPAPRMATAGAKSS